MVVGASGVETGAVVDTISEQVSNDTFRSHKLDLGVVECCVGYHIVDLGRTHLRLNNADAVVFVYDPHALATLDVLAETARTLRLADYDMSKTILVGSGETARVFAKDNHLGHYASRELLGTIRTVLSGGGGRTDVIRLGEEVEASPYSGGRC